MQCIDCSQHLSDNEKTKLEFLSAGLWYCRYCHKVYYYNLTSEGRMT